MLLRILIGVAVLSLCGCASQVNKAMESWLGHDQNDLIAAWGPPTQTMSDNHGGTILIYNRSGQMVLPGQTTTRVNAYGNTAYATTTSTPDTVINMRRTRMFWAHADGTIYRWSWQGL